MPVACLQRGQQTQVVLHLAENAGLVVFELHDRLLAGRGRADRSLQVERDQHRPHVVFALLLPAEEVVAV